MQPLTVPVILPPICPVITIISPNLLRNGDSMGWWRAWSQEALDTIEVNKGIWFWCMRTAEIEQPCEAVVRLGDTPGTVLWTPKTGSQHFCLQQAWITLHTLRDCLAYTLSYKIHTLYDHPPSALACVAVKATHICFWNRSMVFWLQQRSLSGPTPDT